MRRALALAAAVVVCCGAAWGQRLTRSEYARAMGAAARELEVAARSPEGREARVEKALARIPSRAEVEDGASALPVDNRVLLRSLRLSLRQGDEGVRAAAGVLRSLEQSLTIEPEPAPANADAVLRRVLARREFRPSALERLRARAYEAAYRLLDRLVQALPSVDWRLAGQAARAVMWALLALAAAGLLYLLVRLALSMAPAQPRPAPGDPAAQESRRTCAEWLAAAEAALGEGDHRGALRALHMAALLRLDEVGVIAFESSATDGRLVAALRRKGLAEVAASLAALNHLFARAWYGRAPAGPAEYAKAQEHWLALEGLVAQ